MNPAQLLDQAAQAMAECRPSDANTFVVGYQNGKIVCIPLRSGQKLEICFATFPHSTIIQGLTSKQWDELSDKIATFYFQRGIL